MFPYLLNIPKNLKHFVSELNVLIAEHECDFTSKGKNGTTTVSLYFKSEKERTDFVSDLKLQLPAFTGLGIRLLSTL